MKTIIFLGFAAALLCSCTARLGDYTMLSTKNIDMNRAGGYYVEDGKRVTGGDHAWMAYVFPLRNPNMKTATDNAIENAGKDCVGLTDVVVESYYWNAILFGKTGIEVTGTPVYKKSVDKKGE